jgi:hypothetical protein
MSLHYPGKVFLVAGIVILVSSGVRMTDARGKLVTGQGSTIIGQNAASDSEDAEWHAVSTQEPRSLAGEIALGTLFVLLGLGIHIFTMRRRVGERRVQVHGPGPKDKPERPRGKQHWILWMNVRI